MAYIIYTIKTSGKTGSPGYLESKAPAGDQWIIGGVHAKVAEGTPVRIISDKPNTNNFTEIEILVGVHKGFRVWVKRTHVVETSVTPIDITDAQAIEAAKTLIKWVYNVVKSLT